jgi:hypothetical protein
MNFFKRRKNSIYSDTMSNADESYSISPVSENRSINKNNDYIHDYIYAETTEMYDNFKNNTQEELVKLLSSKELNSSLLLHQLDSYRRTYIRISLEYNKLLDQISSSNIYDMMDLEQQLVDSLKFCFKRNKIKNKIKKNNKIKCSNNMSIIDINTTNATLVTNTKMRLDNAYREYINTCNQSEQAKLSIIILHNCINNRKSSKYKIYVDD